MIHENVFLGLGSNLGDRLHHLTRCLNEIASLPKTWLVACSSVYETEPVGDVRQNTFFNLVVQVTTDHDPESFVVLTQEIEAEVGRERRIRWGPRVIDIDILYWGAKTVSTSGLQIPHPEAEKRRFVLAPLCEIAPEFQPPPKFVRVADLIQNLLDDKWVKPIVARQDYETKYLRGLLAPSIYSD